MTRAICYVAMVTIIPPYITGWWTCRNSVVRNCCPSMLFMTRHGNFYASGAIGSRNMQHVCIKFLSVFRLHYRLWSFRIGENCRCSLHACLPARRSNAKGRIIRHCHTRRSMKFVCLRVSSTSALMLRCLSSVQRFLVTYNSTIVQGVGLRRKLRP